MYRRCMHRFALITILICCACGADEPTGKQRCEQVRDRIVDLHLADATSVDVKAHRAALRRALGDDFIASCATNLTTAQQRCVLGARDAASATACTKK